MGDLILQEKYWNWSNWNVGLKRFKHLIPFDYHDQRLVDEYEGVVWHLGPYKRIYKRYIKTYAEARTET